MPSLTLLTFVGGVPEMAAFYQRLGVILADAEPPWDALHRSGQAPGGLSVDLDAEHFAAKWNAGHPGGSRVVVGFSLETRDEVDATFRDMTDAGYKAQQEPYDAFWGARYAVLEDPDGNSVGLMSPPDPTLASAPPAI